MYNASFGFKEKPFKLVPNPDFLFLSRSHEEALAHLTYATTQGDGFVEITGEVGTGKTTLCRVFLENLDPSVDAAFIFNTSLDAQGLLKAINRELSIDASAETTTELIHTLNNFLVENSSRGRSVILLIDEAQNLGVETLEQLRMLSNLETTKNKLIQIILVGQPELETLLASHALRQLGQRINLSCRLLPMTLNETREYIDHRINVASRRRAEIFTPGAKRSIYNYSGGIPRLVNIACDRALVAAYGLNRARVDRSTAKLAIRELCARRQERPASRPTAGKFVIPGLLILVILVMAGYRFFPMAPLSNSLFPTPDRSTHSLSVSPPPMPQLPAPRGLKTLEGEAAENISVPAPSPKTGAPEPAAPGNLEDVGPAPIQPAETIQGYLAQNAPTSTRESALGLAISIWQQAAPPSMPPTPMVSDIRGEHNFFKIASIEQGFDVIRLHDDFPTVKKLNLPAILPFTLPDRGEPGYLLIVGITADNEWIITAGEDTTEYQVLPHDLAPFLTGAAYIPYRERPGQGGIISKLSPGTQIIKLKLLLRQLGFQGINLSSDYDEDLRQAIIRTQSENGITKDGIAGPITRALLYNLLDSPSTPRLIRLRSQGDR